MGSKTDGRERGCSVTVLGRVKWQIWEESVERKKNLSLLGQNILGRGGVNRAGSPLCSDVLLGAALPSPRCSGCTDPEVILAQLGFKSGE